MNTPLRIEMYQIGEGGFTVIVGDLIAHELARDEALGVIAWALFGPEKAHPFLRLIAGRATYYGSQPR